MGLILPDDDGAVEAALDVVADETETLLALARSAFETNDSRVSADVVVAACLTMAEALEHLRFHLIIDDFGGDPS